MEHVFVVDRSAFFDGDWPQGFVQLDDADRFLTEAFLRGRFVPRDQAEGTPALKQWIPYCMLCCGDAADPEPDGILLVQRTNKQSEARLHESWSIGLGGHIEPVDDEPGQARNRARDSERARAFFERALERELREELHLPEPAPEDTEPLPRPRLVGLINDDSTAVGKVHAGLAYRLDVPWPLLRARERIGIREISKMRGGFTSLVEFAELWQTPSQFESWSQFLIRAEIVGAKGG